MQDPTGAKEQFTAALEKNPKSIHTWLKMANIHLDQSNLEESMKCFEKALGHNPDDPDIYYHRGQSKTQKVYHSKRLTRVFQSSLS